MKTKCGLFRAEVQTGQRQKSRSGGRQRSKYGEAVHRQKHKDVGRSVVKKQAEFRAQAGKGQGKRQTKEKHTWQQYQKHKNTGRLTWQKVQSSSQKQRKLTWQKVSKRQYTNIGKTSRGKRFKHFTKTEKTHVAKSVQKAVYKHRQVTMQGAHPEQ